MQFHFLYIFVGRVDRIDKTVHLTRLFVLFPFRPLKFGGQVEQIFSQTAHAVIWAHKDWKQIFVYFKLSFHNELLHWEKNRFLVFFRAGLHLHVRKISTFSVKQFKFFCKNIPYFGQKRANIIFLVKYLHFHTSTNQKK